LQHVYTSDIVFAPLASAPLITLIQIYLGSDDVMEFTKKFVKISLA